MDRISDSGSDDLGSIPNGGTNQSQGFYEKNVLRFGSGITCHRTFFVCHDF